MKPLTEVQLSRLLDTKICFNYSDPNRAWVTDGIVAFPRRAVHAEDYASYFVATEFHSIGAFSYSWSPFPEFVSLGRFCSIAHSVQVLPPAHPTNLFTTSSMLYDPQLLHRQNYYRDRQYENDDSLDRTHPTNDKDIEIGHDVYVGVGVKLRRGVTIGDGAIVGAWSVVTKDVPPYAVVVGNPARVVRWRYGEEQIQALRKLAWWNYDFRAVLNKLDPEDIDAFIGQARALIAQGALPSFSPRKHDLSALLQG